MSLRPRANSLVALFGVLLVAMSARAEPPAKQEAAKKPLVHITISKETTRITGPLREDGYVDYVAALNERAGKGVTPENNSAVLFWRAMGPSEIGERRKERFFGMLGVRSPPEEGEYFVTLDEYARSIATSKGGELSDEQRFEMWDQLHEAMRRPWSKEEFPVLAGWLSANRKPLKLLVDASRRPRHYDPLIPYVEWPEGTVFGCVLSVFTRRDVARALTARAMFQADRGRIDNAWSDLQACHRFARLLGQGVDISSAMLSILIERNVCWAEESILQHARLTADQARAMRTDLRRLGPMPKMVDRIDIGERYMFLDSAAILDREGVGQLVRVTRLADLNGKTDGAIETIVSWAGRVIIDWDQVLRTGNSWYDRMVDARGKSTPPQRKVAMDKIAADLEQQTDRIRDPKSLAFDLIGNPCETVSKSMVVILLAAELPMIATTADAEDCAAMRSEITDLGFALAAYRADHDAYPARLDDLVPAYVAEVPRDIFADASLRYKRRPGGYLLYSVGINGKDDGGRGYEDRGELDDWDDVAIRVPARKRKGG